MKNIYLIGMMGSGKSTTAAELSKLLKLKAVDLDDLVVEKTHKSINDIFKEDGEAAFRDIEEKLLVEISSRSGQVVATGGGVVLKSANVDRMCNAGTVIYLKTDFPVLWERVKHNQERPLLRAASPEAALREIFRARVPLYEKAAHHAFLTDRKTPKEVAREIFERLFK